jgi:hypothetical protein
MYLIVLRLMQSQAIAPDFLEDNHATVHPQRDCYGSGYGAGMS